MVESLHNRPATALAPADHAGTPPQRERSRPVRVSVSRPGRGPPGAGGPGLFDTFQWITAHLRHRRDRDTVANAPVSIRDVAAYAGVSVGTVSNVLNRPDVVAEPTRSRVQAAIKRLGFIRNES